MLLARRQVVDTRLGSKLLIVAESMPLLDHLRKFEDFLTVRDHIFIDIAEVNRLHTSPSAAFCTCGDLAHLDSMGAEHTFLNGSFPMRYWKLWGILRETKLCRSRRRVSPIEEPYRVWTGRHAESAADAPIMVDQYHSVIASVGCVDRAYFDARWILTLHTGAGEIHFPA